MMNKIIQKIEEAEKIIANADHILYVSFPLIQDKRLLIRVLSELKKAILEQVKNYFDEGGGTKC